MLLYVAFYFLTGSAYYGAVLTATNRDFSYANALLVTLIWPYALLIVLFRILIRWS